QIPSGVARDSSGRVFVVFSEFSPREVDGGIFGRLFDGSQVPLGQEFQLNSYTTGTQLSPRVGVDSSGRFVVVWHGANSDVIGRRFSNAGAPLGPEFQVNSYTTNYAGSPHIAVAPAGQFLVVWQEETPFPNPGVVSRLYTSAGVPVGPPCLVNTTTFPDGAS